MSFNFEFFESLSAEEAERFKVRFLDEGARALAGLRSDVQRAGVVAYLSIGSIVPVLTWLATHVVAMRRPPDTSVPDWIKTWPEYEKNAIDFDTPSKGIVIRAAYYLGESFVHEHNALSWALGELDTAEEHQPVVTGFSGSAQMAVLLVATNLFARIAVDRSKTGDVKRAIDVVIERTARGASPLRELPADRENEFGVCRRAVTRQADSGSRRIQDVPNEVLA